MQNYWSRNDSSTVHDLHEQPIRRRKVIELSAKLVLPLQAMKEIVPEAVDDDQKAYKNFHVVGIETKKNGLNILSPVAISEMQLIEVVGEASARLNIAASEVCEWTVQKRRILFECERDAASKLRDLTNVTSLPKALPLE